MRREYTLDAVNNQFAVELTFYPSSIIVLNNTDQSVYLRIGSTGIPNASFYDREILPTSSGIPSNVALPNNSYQFAGFLPTPGDTTKNAKVIFQGTADPFSNRPLRPGGINSLTPGSGNLLTSGMRLRNYQEYTLNAANPAQVMSLEFVADMVFILNNSDAFLYLNQGGTATPNSQFNDLTIPPTSYTIFNPHGGFDFAAFLDSPSAKDCFIIFAYGYADEFLRIKEWLGDWDWYLPPLTIPGLQYYFLWNFSPFLIDCEDTDTEGFDWMHLFPFWLVDTASQFSAIPFPDWIPGLGYQTVFWNAASATIASALMALPAQVDNIRRLRMNFTVTQIGSGNTSAIIGMSVNNTGGVLSQFAQAVPLTVLGLQQLQVDLTQENLQAVRWGIITGDVPGSGVNPGGEAFLHCVKAFGVGVDPFL